jgi:hypothetical protein
VFEHVQKIKNHLLHDNVNNDNTVAVEHKTLLQNCSPGFMDAHNRRLDLTNQDLEDEIDSINSSIKAFQAPAYGRRTSVESL